MALIFIKKHDKVNKIIQINILEYKYPILIIH
jgi:hypothetical protein